MSIKVFPEQNKFMAGEVSPLIYGRTEIEARKAGVKVMENFISRPQGPAWRRPGFKFLDTVGGTVSKIFSFVVDSTTSYWIIFTDTAPKLYVVVINGTDVTTIVPTYGEAYYSDCPYTAAEIPLLQAELTPEGTELYIACRTKRPCHIVFSTGPAFEFDGIPFTGTYTAAGLVTDWTTSDAPGSVTFFQGRSYWGGSISYPERVWASDAGSTPPYSVFTTPAATATSSIDITHTKNGIIQWLAGLTKLLIGTEFHEVILTGDDNLVANTTNPRFEIQSAYGSDYIQATAVGDKIIYVSADGRKIRDMDYEWTKDRWISRDILFVSEHLTEGTRVSELVFAQNPYNLLLVKLQNGELLIATYERGNDIIGWGRHPITGAVSSIGVLSYLGESRIGILFDRDVIADTLHFENLIDPGQLDSYAIVTHSPAANTITGLVHLANQTVGVKADGIIHPDITLDASGDGVITFDAESIEVGFNYIAKLTPLPFVNDIQNGTTRSFTKKWNKAYVQIVNSYFPKINGIRPGTESGIVVGVSLSQGDYDVPVQNLGWSLEGLIEIEQDLPLQTIITAIYGDMTIDII